MKAILKACLALLFLLVWNPLAVEVVPDTTPDVKLTGSETNCVAIALWHEARGETIEGQRAVLDVILHRRIHYNKSACKVLSMPHQFSWFKGWYQATKPMLLNLEQVKYQPRILNDENVQFFYSLAVLKRPPGWARKMDCKPIGNHAFCALKGAP